MLSRNKNLTLLILIIIIFVIALWFWTSLGFPTQGQVCEEAKNATPHCTQHNLAIAILFTTLLWVEKFHDSLLVLFTFILAVYTYRLWKGADETARAQLRAYITVKTKLVTEQTAREKYIHYIKVTNRGRTPAYKLMVLSRTKILPHHIDPNMDTSLSMGENPGISALGPDEFVEHHSSAEKRYNPIELQQIRSQGAVRLYTYGIVTYLDIFGRKQFNRFCAYLEYVPSNKGTRMTVFNSAHHNDES